VRYEVAESEKAIRPLRRSLYVVLDIAAGEALTEQNVRSIRPGLGLAPKYQPEVLGRAASRAIKRGTPLNWSMIAVE
jgi:sialic acid synthase SpsE